MPIGQRCFWEKIPIKLNPALPYDGAGFIQHHFLDKSSAGFNQFLNFLISQFLLLRAKLSGYAGRHNAGLANSFVRGIGRDNVGQSVTPGTEYIHSGNTHKAVLSD